MYYLRIIKKIVIKADKISYIKNQEKTFATGDVVVSDNIKIYYYFC